MGMGMGGLVFSLVLMSDIWAQRFAPLSHFINHLFRLFLVQIITLSNICEPTRHEFRMCFRKTGMGHDKVLRDAARPALSNYQMDPAWRRTCYNFDCEMTLLVFVANWVAFKDLCVCVCACTRQRAWVTPS